MTRLVSLLSVLGVVWLLGGCGQQQSGAAVRIEDRVVRLTAAHPSVNISFLSAELSEMRVLERVNVDTGEVTYGPRFLATLKVQNQTEDQTARLVGGELTYVDHDGKRLALAEGRGESTLSFYSYGSDRLDPGADTSMSVDVPFPASAADGKALSEVRLHLSFIPSPYREVRAAFPVSLTP